jgi:hypothetical protein
VTSAAPLPPQHWTYRGCHSAWPLQRADRGWAVLAWAKEKGLAQPIEVGACGEPTGKVAGPKWEAHQKQPGASQCSSVGVPPGWHAGRRGLAWKRGAGKGVPWRDGAPQARNGRALQARTRTCRRRRPTRVAQQRGAAMAQPRPRRLHSQAVEGGWMRGGRLLVRLSPARAGPADTAADQEVWHGPGQRKAAVRRQEARQHA